MTSRVICSILRSTAYIVDPAAAATSMTVARQPAADAQVKVRVKSGTTGSGTVTVTGTLDGDAVAETLTFSANGTQLSEYVWDTVSTVATSGLADESTPPTVSVEATDSSGAPIKQTASLATGRPIAFSFSGSGNAKLYNAGVQEEDITLMEMAYESAYAPLVGDYVSEDDTGDLWLIREVRTLPSRLRPRRWEMRCTRFQT